MTKNTDRQNRGPKISHDVRKNFTAVPVPFRVSGQTFNVWDHHSFASYYGLNTGVSYFILFYIY